MRLLIVDEFTEPQVRVLIDPGSEVSLVTNKLVARHRLARNSTRLSINGVGGLSAETALHGVAVSLQSLMSNFRLTLNAFFIGRITSPLPSFSLSDPHWSHISGLQLADPDFLVPSDVDVLLGADVYGRLILPRVTQGRLSDPVAQETKFGWVVLGPTEDLGTSDLRSLHSSATHDDLRDALTRFWEQEEVHVARGNDLAPEDESGSLSSLPSLFSASLVQSPAVVLSDFRVVSHVIAAISCFTRIFSRSMSGWATWRGFRGTLVFGLVAAF